MPDAHSLFGPSSAKRWMTCPGSVALSEDLPDHTSVYAAEGTAAHTLCERSLQFGTPCDTFIGQTIDDFEVTAEMAAHCQTFVDFVTEKASAFKGTSMDLEQRVISDFDDRFGGTVDCVLRNEKKSALAIIDFKYGAGVPVEVENNEQLLCYALLVWKGEENIALAIVQPRCQHMDGPIRTWNMSGEELQAFKDRVVSAIEVIDSPAIEGESLPLVTGDHCRWCKAQAVCPQQYKEVVEEAVGDFTPVVDLPVDQRVSVFQKTKQIKAYLKAIEESLTASLLAGDSIPGYKLVQALGNRKWSVPEEELFKKLRSKRIKKTDSTVAVIKSPAQMEKIKGLDGNWLAQFIERPLSGPKIVEESDKREAYTPPSPEDDFEPIERTDAEITAEPVTTDLPDFMM